MYNKTEVINFGILNKINIDSINDDGDVIVSKLRHLYTMQLFKRILII